jgi:hypothetical protein
VGADGEADGGKIGAEPIEAARQELDQQRVDVAVEGLRVVPDRRDVIHDPRKSVAQGHQTHGRGQDLQQRDFI